MSNQSESKPDNPSPAKAKQSTPDRRKNSGGIRDGGRRAADKTPVASRKAKIWFGLSLALTLLIMAWTFTIPFRSDKPMFAWSKSDMPASPTVNDDILSHPEHQMSADEYRAYVMDLEDELQEQLAAKYEVPYDLPDTIAAKAKEANRVANLETRLNDLQKLEKSVKGGFSEGSVHAIELMETKKELEEEEK